MKIGLFLNTQTPDSDALPTVIADCAEQVRTARDAGFDIICAGQHYLSAPYSQPATLPFLARMAAESGDMAVCAGVILLPLHNPVDVAETVATMDAICGGRFVFGIGLGYRDDEYAAFGVRRSERVPRMTEALEVIKALWTEDEVEFDGRFYHVPRSNPTTRPVQKPHPPIWVAANHDNAIRRAGRWGYPWMINPHATMTMIADQIPLYRDALAEGGQPDPGELPLVREMYVATDRETAFVESQPYLEGKYAAYAAWGQDKALPGEEDFTVPYADLARDRFVLGAPDDIVREIERYERELGVTHILFRMQWPGMPQDQVLRELDILGRDVVPRI